MVIFPSDAVSRLDTKREAVSKTDMINRCLHIACESVGVLLERCNGVVSLTPLTSSQSTTIMRLQRDTLGPFVDHLLHETTLKTLSFPFDNQFENIPDDWKHRDMPLYVYPGVDSGVVAEEASKASDEGARIRGIMLNKLRSMANTLSVAKSASLYFEDMKEQYQLPDYGVTLRAAMDNLDLKYNQMKMELENSLHQCQVVLFYWCLVI